jgi:hypothetical protein
LKRGQRRFRDLSDPGRPVAHRCDSAFNTPANGAYGGALDIYPSSTTMIGCTVSGNQAVGGDGGTGVYVGDAEGGAINNYGNLTISGSTFDQNQALAGSGGNSGPGVTEAFLDYSFGGAIANTSAFSKITNTIFSYDQAAGGNDSTATATDFGAVGGAEGGAIYDELGSAGTFAGCTLSHDDALGGNGNTGSGSVVLVGEGLGGARVALKKTKVTANSAANGGANIDGTVNYT